MRPEKTAFMEFGGATLPHLQQGRRLPVPSSNPMRYYSQVHYRICWPNCQVCFNVPFWIKFDTLFEFSTYNDRA